MNLRKRAAALLSILPSAAIQLSQPGPQASGAPLTRAKEMAAAPSTLRRAAAAGRDAGLTGIAGLA
ncbi:hypothetical protein ACVIJ6_004986 [Bradyrhizobium sp. USDA 4369]